MPEVKPDQTAEDGQSVLAEELTTIADETNAEAELEARRTAAEQTLADVESVNGTLTETPHAEENANGVLAAHESEVEAETEAALNAAAEDGAEESEAEKPKGFFRRRVQNQEVKKLKAENEKLAAEVELYRERYLRIAAEMENFRKRTDRDFYSRVQNETARLILAFLPLLDDLDRSLNAKDEARDYEALLNGVRLIQQNFGKILGDHGVAPMAAADKEFDPNLHEALTEMASEGKAAGLVLEEHVKGYMLRDKVLRPAKVIVSK